jgi:hypothetical protein
VRHGAAAGDVHAPLHRVRQSGTAGVDFVKPPFRPKRFRTNICPCTM